MKKEFLLSLLLFIFFPIITYASAFDVCDGSFALCTTATCKPISGASGFVSCRCDVKTGYSAGTTSCQYPKQTKEGERIYSRYYPIKYYVTCNNSRPWAWCLDSPCIVDKKDPTKADCKCSLVKNKGTYIIVTDTPTSSTCQTDVWSSATVKGVTDVTDFLKTQSELQPFPIKVQKGE